MRYPGCAAEICLLAAVVCECPAIVCPFPMSTAAGIKNST